MNNQSKRIKELSRSSIFLVNLVDSLAKAKCHIICEVLIANQLEILMLKSTNKYSKNHSIEDFTRASKIVIANLQACSRRDYKDPNPKN